VKVTVYVPACVKLGVHENVPEVLVPFAVNVLPVVAGEEAAVNEVIAWPSGSDADTVKVISVFSFPEAEAGAVTAGGRSLGDTVSDVAAEPDNAFDAVNVSMYVPACASDGVQLKVPLVLPAPAVNVLPVVAGALTSVKDVIAWPSGSAAVTTTVPGMPVPNVAVPGAVTTGARSTLFTVIAVDAVAETPFATAVNVAV
jgi:hypothetical protein